MSTKTYKMNISAEDFFRKLSTRTLKEPARINSNITRSNTYDFFGTVYSKEAHICGKGIFIKKFFNPLVNIKINENSDNIDSINVSTKTSFTLLSKVFIALYAVFYIFLPYTVILLNFRKSYEFMPFSVFIPAISTVGVVLILTLLWQKNKKNFYARFETLYKDFIIQ